MTKLDEAKTKKDVVYVDVEDDITSIIEKVKSSKSAIVALVPPKRLGALQSVVNLKLLDRAATSAHKRIVLITSDHALTALAAGVSLPVARNLQSKPEIAEKPELANEDDEVIEGSDVTPMAPPTEDDAVTEEIEDEIAPAASAVTIASDRPRRRGAAGVPNFDAFRKKLLLIGGGVALLITFLVWAIVFAPRATITITAKTTPYSVNKPLTARSGATLDADKGIVPAVVKEIKKTASVDFQATGTKDVGEKATGKVKIKTDAYTILVSGLTVPAGSTVTSAGGKTYTTDGSVTFAKGDATGLSGASVGVTATASGASYNGATGSATMTVQGVSSVAFTEATGGGTDKTITVVSEQDAQAAKEKLQTQDATAIKSDLKKQFSADVIVIEESYVVVPGNPSVAPAVGQEATTAKLSVETTYSMIGLTRSDLRAIVEKDLTKQLAGLPNQTIYDAGLDAIRFAGYSTQDATYTVNVVTSGRIGPSIDTTALAKKLVGKREGEIIADVKTYEGIQNVNVSLSPFWVSTAPSADKITIKFLVDNAKK